MPAPTSFRSLAAGAVAVVFLAGVGGCADGAATAPTAPASSAVTTTVARPVSVAPATVPPATAVPGSGAPAGTPAETPATTPADTAAPAPAAAPADTGLEGCPDAPRAAVADKASQRFWLCADGASITGELRMTTASAGYGLPPVGTYEVFARDEVAWGTHGEQLDRFVAFYTTPKGNRIAFHQYVNQDPATLGDLDQRGQSSGCFRVSTDDSHRVWDYLQIGDPVVVITN